MFPGLCFKQLILFHLLSIFYNKRTNGEALTWATLYYVDAYNYLYYTMQVKPNYLLFLPLRKKVNLRSSHHDMVRV